MFNAEKVREMLRMKRQRMDSMTPPILVTIDDLLNDEQLSFSIDVGTGKESGLSFTTIVLEFWPH